MQTIFFGLTESIFSIDNFERKKWNLIKIIAFQIQIFPWCFIRLAWWIYWINGYCFTRILQRILNKKYQKITSETKIPTMLCNISCQFESVNPSLSHSKWANKRVLEAKSFLFLKIICISNEKYVFIR